jgi:transmembrane sensor
MEDSNKILLIHKVISGNASFDERVLLEKQIIEEEGYKEIFDQIKVIWEKSSEIRKPPVSFSKSVLKEEIFNIIDKPVVNFENKTEKKIKSINLKIAVAVAAVLLVLFSVTAVFLNSSLSGTTIKAKNEVVYNKLPDDSRIFVSRNSSIKYSKDFAVTDRIVFLEGSAFFNVRHDPNKPFIIKTADNTIKVVGTSFQVINVNNKTIEVNVFTGIVKFYAKNGEYITLKQGQTAVYNYQNQRFTESEKLDLKPDLRAEYLTFQDAELSFVFERLSQMFDCQIDVKCGAVSGMKGYTSPGVAGDNIEYYFKTIKKLYKINIVEISSDKFEVDCL